MKTLGLFLAAAAAAGLAWAGHYRSPDFYPAALVAGFVFFRLATGSACPLVWLATKLGAKGLSCPTDFKK
ncbi:MAG: hypothetical protein PHV33_06390 [Elusimicrobiales bacterium]|nr:hypothetical protein [Elusimicrobiales bacterium]